jgi:ribose transport system permease protein
MREHKGYLYIGGLENNRIGRLRLPNADPTWTGWDSYWARDKQDNGKLPPIDGQFCDLAMPLTKRLKP